MTDLSTMPPAAQQLASARAHALAARAEMEAAVVEARRQRMTWAEIAELSGYADRASAAKAFVPVVRAAGVGVGR